MTDSADYRPGDELPRRLAGELELPAPGRPLYFETDEVFLVQVRDGLKNYEWPDQQGESTTEDFRWMQPAED